MNRNLHGICESELENQCPAPNIHQTFILKPGADDGFLSCEIENIVFTLTKISGFCPRHPQTADNRPASLLFT
jgi:hypothetical protein